MWVPFFLRWTIRDLHHQLVDSSKKCTWWSHLIVWSHHLNDNSTDTITAATTIDNNSMQCLKLTWNTLMDTESIIDTIFNRLDNRRMRLVLVFIIISAAMYIVFYTFWQWNFSTMLPISTTTLKFSISFLHHLLFAAFDWIICSSL